jgi:hypothetical protein
MPPEELYTRGSSHSVRLAAEDLRLLLLELGGGERGVSWQRG